LLIGAGCGGALALQEDLLERKVYATKLCVLVASPQSPDVLKSSHLSLMVTRSMPLQWKKGSAPPRSADPFGFADEIGMNAPGGLPGSGSTPEAESIVSPDFRRTADFEIGGHLSRRRFEDGQGLHLKVRQLIPGGPVTVSVRCTVTPNRDLPSRSRVRALVRLENGTDLDLDDCWLFYGEGAAELGRAAMGKTLEREAAFVPWKDEGEVPLLGSLLFPRSFPGPQDSPFTPDTTFDRMGEERFYRAVRAARGEFRKDPRTGLPTGTCFLLARAGKDLGEFPVQPRPEVSASLMLWTCPCRIAFTDGWVFIPSSYVPGRWTDDQGRTFLSTDTSVNYGFQGEAVRLIGENGGEVFQRFRVPLLPEDLEEILLEDDFQLPEETGTFDRGRGRVVLRDWQGDQAGPWGKAASSDQTTVGEVECSLFNWVTEAWDTKREGVVFGSQYVHPRTGEVRYRMASTAPSGWIEPVRLCVLAKVRSE
jgi:hypothetical protein